MSVASPSKAPLQFGHDVALTELRAIADWWKTHAIDHEHGGFLGEIDFFGEPVPKANKGIILNSRILWFFSQMAIFERSVDYQQVAARAFHYLMKHFDDPVQGGAFWELDYQGEVINGKKQTYAQCFCIYAFSAYYEMCGDQNALQKANQYFELVFKHTLDRQHDGFIEACNQSWQSIDDYRLSEKDLNVPKSMNTHLHVLEAFAALHRVAPSEKTELALKLVLDVFERYIIDANTYHLKLFFDLDWEDQSSAFSYGHDIEASWLMWEAAEILGDEAVLARFHRLAVKMADVCLSEALGTRGQICDEFDLETKHRSEASYWWVQAEALVGFLNAYKLSGNRKYRDVCDGIWAFISDYHLDRDKGEWHWLSSADDNLAAPIYKAGFWKAPYHNGRAMMEVCKLFNGLNQGNPA